MYNINKNIKYNLIYNYKEHIMDAIKQGSSFNRKEDLQWWEEDIGYVLKEYRSIESPSAFVTWVSYDITEESYTILKREIEIEKILT